MKKIALITGANKGIGFETARQLGKKDFTVLVGARDKQRGEEAVKTLKAENIDAYFLQLDPLDTASIKKAADEVTSKYGLLDVLVNNAGTMVSTDRAAPSSVPVSAFQETYNLNVFALHEVTQAFWPLLNKSAAARLVNVSSALGSLALHSNGTLGDYKVIAYDSSKAAVNMMTTHYAYEWKNTPHKANTIHPGSVKTDLNPQGELTVQKGAETSVDLATIGADGPSGKFFHLGQELPW